MNGDLLINVGGCSESWEGENAKAMGPESPHIGLQRCIQETGSRHTDGRVEGFRLI